MASVTEGGSLFFFRIPSAAFISFLDRWRLARHRSLLEDHAVSKFVRLVQARVGSYDFEPDPGFREPWDESEEELPRRIRTDPFELLRATLERVATTRLIAFRAVELAAILSITETKVHGLFVRNDRRLREHGFGVMLAPSISGGPVYVILRLRAIPGRSGSAER